MRTGFRFIAIGVAFLLVLVLGLGAVLLFVNFTDDELAPEVVQLIEERPRQIAITANGYFAWIGIVGPDDVDPHTWGRRWFDEALQADRDRSTQPLIIESEVDTTYSQTAGVFCDKVATCLDDVSDQPAAAKATLQAFEGKLTRCDAMLEYSDYQEAWRPDFGLSLQFPHYPAICRQLKAIRFALAVAEHRDNHAIAHLEDEITLHTRQLRGAVTLLEKLMAVYYLRQDYLLLNEYINKHPQVAADNSDRMVELLLPLDDKSRSMETVIKTEWVFSARGLLDLRRLASNNQDTERGFFSREGGVVDRLAAQLFYLPNATVNEYYKWYRALAELEGSSGDEYRSAIKEVIKIQNSKNDFGYSEFTLRNPVGKILINLAQPNMLNYFRARDDLLALRAAVAFQHDLILRGISADSDIQSALEKAQLLHASTGEQAVWDRQSQQLVYPGSSTFDSEELRVELRLP